MVELVWLGCAVDALMSPTIRRRRFGGARMHEHVANETDRNSHGVLLLVKTAEHEEGTKGPNKILPRSARH